MKKSILSFLIYIIGVSPVFAQTYQELSERAIACTEQDRLTQAEDYIRQALKLEPANPHNALLFSNLGTIQRRQRDYDQALESHICFEHCTTGCSHSFESRCPES